MKKKRALTESDFEALRPLLNISEERIAAARMALVEGTTLKAAADVYGWSRQAVDDAIQSVWRIYERYQEGQTAGAHVEKHLPDGWEKVTLVAPSTLIKKFRLEIRGALKEQREATPKQKAVVINKAPANKSVPSKKVAAKKPAIKK